LLLNPASLNLVRPELTLLLKQAQGEFDLALQPGSTHDLASCRAMLLQADGVLRLLELGDAAQLARELADLLAAPPTRDSRAAEAATRGFFVLNRYLDYLAGRRQAIPELLIEELNSLRSQLKRPPLGDGHFAGCGAGAESVHCPGSPRARAAADPALTRRLRHMYQVGLLGMLKGRSDPVHLRLMQRAVERILRMAGGGAGSDFWWLLDGVLEGIASGELRATPARGRLLSRADRQFKDFCSEPGPAGGLDPALRGDLLYLASKCTRGGKSAALRAAFGIAEPTLGDAKIEEERRLLMGTSADSIDSMVRVLRGDLHRIKDELEQAGASGELRAGAPAEISAALRRVSGVLREGGLRSSATTLDAQLARLEGAVSSGTALARGDVIAIADALVYVETTLSGLGRAQGLARSLREQQQGGLDDDGVTREALDEARIAMLQAARECIESVKRDVTTYVEGGNDVMALAPSGGQLAQVKGALQMLQHAGAASVAARTGAATIRAIEHGPPVPAEAFAEGLADVLICLEYYIAALENGEEPDPLMLKLAEESLATIRAAR
jgi:hypothetical protein